MRYWSAAFALIACAALYMGLNDWTGLSVPAACGLFLASVMLALLSLLLGHKQGGAQAPVRRDSRRKLGDA